MALGALWYSWARETFLCLCVKVCALCPLEGLCPFTHTPGNRRHCVPVRLCLCLHPPPTSPSIRTPSQVVGAWPQLRSHAFSRTNDFYQNDNELMTHGSSQALERSQRTTGNRMEAGGTWGLMDLVSQPILALFRF